MNNKKIIIELNNITEEQAIAIEDMLATWENLGHLGSSRWTAFLLMLMVISDLKYS